MLSKGCVGYLASLVGNEKEKLKLEDIPIAPKLEDIPIVREYPDMFPNELPGRPPTRGVEFSINLVPGTASISKPSIGWLLQKKELKSQLK